MEMSAQDPGTVFVLSLDINGTPEAGNPPGLRSFDKVRQARSNGTITAEAARFVRS
jgi:hypothetical protein